MSGTTVLHVEKRLKNAGVGEMIERQTPPKLLSLLLSDCDWKLFFSITAFLFAKSLTVSKVPFMCVILHPIECTRESLSCDWLDIQLFTWHVVYERGERKHTQETTETENSVNSHSHSMMMVTRLEHFKWTFHYDLTGEKEGEVLCVEFRAVSRKREMEKNTIIIISVFLSFLLPTVISASNEEIVWREGRDMRENGEIEGRRSWDTRKRGSMIFPSLDSLVLKIDSTSEAPSLFLSLPNHPSSLKNQIWSIFDTTISLEAGRSLTLSSFSATSASLNYQRDTHLLFIPFSLSLCILLQAVFSTKLLSCQIDKRRDGSHLLTFRLISRFSFKTFVNLGVLSVHSSLKTHINVICMSHSSRNR